MNARSRTLLIVDDEEAIRNLLSLYLTQFSYSVITAPNGQKAIAICESGAPVDLLITDLQMPEMTGIELARNFARLRPGVPIILISGNMDSDSAAEAAAIPARIDLYQKPFDLGVLESFIETALAGEPGARAPQQAAGPDTRRLKLLLAEDDDAMREQLKRLLVGEYDVVGEVANGFDVAAAVHTHHPDVLLLDISMPGMSGFAVLRQLVRESAPVKTLVVSLHTESAYIEEAERSGASGYVAKRNIRSELAHAVRQVGRGGFYRSPFIR